MTKPSEVKDEPSQVAEAPKANQQPIAVDSDVREGNDIPALLGSGAPQIKVKANTTIMGIAVGETATLVQTEEVRLNIQLGHLSLAE